jgi:hypothetical protein
MAVLQGSRVERALCAEAAADTYRQLRRRGSGLVPVATHHMHLQSILCDFQLLCPDLPTTFRTSLSMFQDGGVDAWLPARDVAPDVVADWEASLERGAVSRLLDMQQFGTERQFLVQWADGAQVGGRRVFVRSTVSTDSGLFNNWKGPREPPAGRMSAGD